jgi:hypothetical protein
VACHTPAEAERAEIIGGQAVKYCACVNGNGFYSSKILEGFRVRVWDNLDENFGRIGIVTRLYIDLGGF